MGQKVVSSLFDVWNNIYTFWFYLLWEKKLWDSLSILDKLWVYVNQSGNLLRVSCSQEHLENVDLLCKEM